MMEAVTFSRDVEVLLIPDGTRVPVPEGARGWITQVLGGNFTVQLTNGRLVRVDAAEGDAIGQAVSEPADALESAGPLDEARIWDVLRTCYDPEIPLDIVELGLVYDLNLRSVEGGSAVDVVMTLTAPGCGMGQVLTDDVKAKLLSLPGVVQAEVELTFEPPWTQDRMSEAGRLELGFF